MKTHSIFDFSKAAATVGVSLETVNEWVKEKIITPSVMADRAEPYFDEQDLIQLEQVKHLYDAGYGISDIRKITKKIGLPQADRIKKDTRRKTQYLTVGELAKRSGLNARTIKYWEERGIIEPTTRSDGGFRLYEESYVLFCNLIQDLQLFGYSLEEIKEAADLFRQFYEIKTGRFSGARDEKQGHFEIMQEKINLLFTRMQRLTQGMNRWKKLLKEKQTEIQAFQKRELREQNKSRSTVKNTGKAKNPAAS